MKYAILQADDDNDDRQFFRDALHKISPEVSCTTLESGHLMISGLTSGAIDLPDLIFLDVNMPELSGWDCLAALKEHEVYKDIPVILYSTSRHKEEISRAKEAGAICFLHKPHDFAILKQALSDVVEHIKEGKLNMLRENSSLFL